MGEMKPYSDDDLLPISALQHLLFCERQAALIHIEQAWAENLYTVEGELLHARAHSESAESRPGRRKEFGMPVRSLALGLTGRVDAVEYRDDGSIMIVEYKRGRPKKNASDTVQLCAQAICLEEMTDKMIAEGALYYGKNKRRLKVAFDSDLRKLTEGTAARLHVLIASATTPPARYAREKCERCSLKGICLPRKLSERKRVDLYLERMIASVNGEAQ